jgi:hypothetical protein
MTLRALFGLVAALAVFTASPSLAVGFALPALTPHGVVSPTDIIPCQAPGGATLQGCKVSDLQSYVTTSVRAYGAVGDGVTDDTAAIQAAINSGLPIYFPPGVYRTTATLNVTIPANDGQTLRGSASWGLPDAFNAASLANSAVIRPSAAVTVALKIDGTPFAGGGYQLSWVQGFGLEHLVFDMTNMTDDAAHVAITQIQAWDGHYSHVRVIHDGLNKRAWLVRAGAFTTQFDTVGGHILDFEGDSSGFGVTTMNILNCDCGRVVSNYAGDLRFIGGAFQGASETKFYLRHSFDVWIQTDVEGTGTYMDVDSSDNGLNDAAELQGCTCTLLAGSPGPNFRSWNQNQVNVGYDTHLTQGSIQLNNNNTGQWNNRSQFLSGGAAQDQYLFQGRTVGESLWGVAGEANWWVGGVVAGDTVIGATGGSGKTWLMAAGVAGASVGANGLTTYGTGTINGGTLAASTLITAPTANIVFGGFGGQQTKPAVDGQIFSLLNAASATFMLCNSAATIGNSFCSVGAGADWRGFSDSGFSVQTYDFDSATGNGTFTGTVTGAKFAGALNGSVGATTPSTVAATTITASSTIAATGVITAAKGVVSTASTVAGLPASPTTGQSGFVTDASACTFAATVTGGGSTKCPVVYTGAAWVAG